jgi:hypothetical protein
VLIRAAGSSLPGKASGFVAWIVAQRFIAEPSPPNPRRCDSAAAERVVATAMTISAVADIQRRAWDVAWTIAFLRKADDSLAR